jgi:hypothetical protein
MKVDVFEANNPWDLLAWTRFIWRVTLPVHRLAGSVVKEKGLGRIGTNATSTTSTVFHASSLIYFSFIIFPLFIETHKSLPSTSLLVICLSSTSHLQSHETQKSTDGTGPSRRDTNQITCFVHQCPQSLWIWTCAHSNIGLHFVENAP